MPVETPFGVQIDVRPVVIEGENQVAVLVAWGMKNEDSVLAPMTPDQAMTIANGIMVAAVSASIDKLLLHFFLTMSNMDMGYAGMMMQQWRAHRAMVEQTVAANAQAGREAQARAAMQQQAEAQEQEQEPAGEAAAPPEKVAPSKRDKSKPKYSGPGWSATPGDGFLEDGHPARTSGTKQ